MNDHDDDDDHHSAAMFYFLKNSHCCAKFIRNQCMYVMENGIPYLTKLLAVTSYGLLFKARNTEVSAF